MSLSRVAMPGGPPARLIGAWQRSRPWKCLIVGVFFRPWVLLAAAAAITAMYLLPDVAISFGNPLAPRARPTDTSQRRTKV